MTERKFSILRRKPGLIDLVTPIIQDLSLDVAEYRLKTDSVPEGSFTTTVMTVPNTGLVDKDVAGAHNVIVPRENVRMIFKPSNFSLPDSDYFWVKLVYVNSGGAELATPTPSAATLVLPPYTGPLASGFTATAPASQLQIDLPRLMREVRIENLETSTDMFVAFEEGGPTVKIPAGSAYDGRVGTAASLWVNGDSATAEFNASFTYAFPL